MQTSHAFHAVFALHKLVRLAYIHHQQSDGTSGASSSTRSLLLPERDRLTNDTPPPSRWSAKMTLTGPPPPVSVIFLSGVSSSAFRLETKVPAAHSPGAVRQNANAQKSIN
jgi:hypothetical protein